MTILWAAAGNFFPAGGLQQGKILLERFAKSRGATVARGRASLRQRGVIRRSRPATLRSTVAYGIARYQVPSILVGPVESTVANKQLQSASVNLVWSPVAFIDIGAEYFWGQRQVVANLFGNEQVLIGKFRVKY